MDIFYFKKACTFCIYTTPILHCAAPILNCLARILHCATPILHCAAPILNCLTRILNCVTPILHYPIPILNCPTPILYCPARLCIYTCRLYVNHTSQFKIQNLKFKIKKNISKVELLQEQIIQIDSVNSHLYKKKTLEDL